MPDVDRHLAGAIEKRRTELGYDVQTLVELTGLTRQGLQPLLRGERKRYQDRLKLPLCKALQWTPDSIDLLLAGGEPVPLPDPEQIAVEELARRLAALEAGVKRLQGEFAAALETGLANQRDVRRRLDRLERQDGRADDGPPVI